MFVWTFFRRFLRKSDFAIKYLKDRNITEELIKEFKIGYAPASWDALKGYLIKKRVFHNFLCGGRGCCKKMRRIEYMTDSGIGLSSNI